MAGGNNGGEVHDQTIEILKSIRDEIHTGFATINERLVSVETRLGQRIDQTNARLDEAVARLDLHSQALARLIGEVGSLNTRFDNFLTGSHREEH